MDSVTHHNRFFDIVGYQQHRLGGKPSLYPKVEKIGAQGFGRQHVEGLKRLVHKKQDWLDHNCPCEANPLVHPPESSRGYADWKPSRPINSIADIVRSRA